jgi:carboxypeptidase family protein
VVPGLELTLTNEETRVLRTTFSSAVGEYVFTAVVPGIYTLRAVRSGYKTFERLAFTIGTQEFPHPRHHARSRLRLAAGATEEACGSREIREAW